MTTTPVASSSPFRKQKPLTAIVRDFLGRKSSAETKAQRQLLQYYASRCRKEAWCNPGHELITSDTGIGHFTIDKANAHFRELGVLSWKKGWGNRYSRGKGKSNLYQLHIDRMELLTFLSTATLVDLALPLSQVRTATLKLSTATSEVSTATLSSSTLQQVAAKVQAFEVSSYEEQARAKWDKGSDKTRSPELLSTKPKGDGHVEPELTAKELKLAKSVAIEMAKTHQAKKQGIVLRRKFLPDLAELLKSFTRQDIVGAYVGYVGQRVNDAGDDPFTEQLPEALKMKITEAHREAARVESDREKAATKMSADAIAKLRAAKEHDAQNKSADARLVAEFNSRDHSVETVMDWLYLLRKDRTENIRKRAIKAFHFLSRGFKVYSIHDLTFLAELLPEEEKMSLVHITNKYPAAVDAIHLALREAAPERLCALGSKCLRAYRRKAAVITGSGNYCGPACRGTAVALAKRSKRDTQQPELPEVAFLTRINTGVEGGTSAN